MLNLLQSEKAAVVSTLTAAKVWLDADATANTTGKMVHVPLRKILDNPYQPRTHYDAEHILSLAMSIRAMKSELAATKGLQQIPMARVFQQQPTDGEMIMAGRDMYINGAVARLITKPNGLVQLMFGHSRLRAFMVLAEGLRSLGKGTAIGMDFSSVTELTTRFADLLDADLDYTEMPLTLGFALDHAMWAHAITENSQRKNITAVEEAVSIQRAIDEFGLTTEEAGKPFGYARSTTANKLRLLQLPVEVRAAIADGRLTERHGRELTRLSADPERVHAVAIMAIDKALPVRRLAEHVDWEEKHLRAEQERAQQLAAAKQALVNGWCLPGQDQPVTVDRISDLESWKLSEFERDSQEDMAFFEHGYCGVHCPCLVVAYSQHRGQRGIQPDPEHAPNVCVACTESAARFEKRHKLRAAGLSIEDQERRQAMADRERKVQEINDEAHTHWQRWLREQDRHALWNSLTFWREAVRGMNFWGMERTLDGAEDVQDACDALLEAMYQRTRAFNETLNQAVHTVEYVQALIDRLEGVSQETEGGVT
ncbi:MAG: hypothetical protein R2932_59130 [Caldilineaceae bacterium]